MQGLKAQVNKVPAFQPGWSRHSSHRLTMRSILGCRRCSCDRVDYLIRTSCMDKICVERLHTGSRDTGETGYVLLQDVLWPPSSDRYTSKPAVKMIGWTSEKSCTSSSFRPCLLAQDCTGFSDRIASTQGWNALILVKSVMAHMSEAHRGLSLQPDGVRDPDAAETYLVSRSMPGIRRRNTYGGSIATSPSII